MKVVIPGGSGHLGSILTKHFVSRGDEVVILSRSPASDSSFNARVIRKPPKIFARAGRAAINERRRPRVL